MTIRYDRKSGAYTDGKHFVRASFIRDYAKKKLGIEIVEQVTKEEVLKTESLPLNNTEKNIKVESSGGTF